MTEDLYMTTTAKTAARIANHENAGHEVWVLGGVVTCITCDRMPLDASGSRPGLVTANQSR